MGYYWISSTKEQNWQEQIAEPAKTGKPNLVLTDETKRVIDGFGGCFNELGFDALSHLSEAGRTQVLDALFLPDGDCQFSICRLPIGASDYALEWYSHNETTDDYEMEHFSIERDRKYLIPYIKEALKRNPDLKLFASPWSPPTWMKFPKAYNFGTLRWEPKVLEAYALYFVKFVQAYKEEGITLHQIHVQNEVVADQKFPSCVWTGEQLREFIGDYLGPAFEKYGIDAEIWLGTINAPEPWEEWMKGTSSDHDAFAHTVLSNPKAYEYVKGVGYQWAGKYAIQRTVQSYPELKYMQTENECGNGENTWAYAQYVHNLFRHYFVNGANAYIYWNMVLEPKGRSTWGWEQNSMITVDPESKKVTKNPEYYVMKHFSHFVNPGALRIETSGPWTGNTTAFLNPDGTKVVVIANPFKDTRELEMDVNGETYSFKLKAESFNTIII
ncbi:MULTISPECIES: glycoside hydrolase family 30 protein [Metabacillus]|uniref:Glycosyl hydrolase n=3 Tax=Metabacillus TaxID=2675233 RepID=A0A179T644_9BACI|nr:MULTISPECIES: glycoside hydrolase family 30 protein [Metabacillus]OAS89495.1 glycosyl hydrolase [Metabacillus litoralis]QNF29017.1 glycoside hydrolase family 30 protein [Metabacillus sp. KUDC1714]